MPADPKRGIRVTLYLDSLADAEAALAVVLREAMERREKRGDRQRDGSLWSRGEQHTLVWGRASHWRADARRPPHE